jgi:hypothetical protein
MLKKQAGSGGGAASDSESPVSDAFNPGDNQSSEGRSHDSGLLLTNSRS